MQASNKLEADGKANRGNELKAEPPTEGTEPYCFFPTRGQAKGSCRSMPSPIHAAKIQTGLHRAEFAARLHRIFFHYIVLDYRYLPALLVAKGCVYNFGV